MKFKDYLEDIRRDQLETKLAILEIQKDLSYHIKRTDLLEASLKNLGSDLKPVQKHVFLVEGIVKVLLSLCVFPAAGWSLYQLLKSLL